MRYRDAPIVSLALIILLTSAAHAQSHVEEGIVVLIGGEHMYGYIDYGNWDKNPNSIVFTKTLNKASISIFPEDIEGFYVADEHYISATVQVENSSTKLAFMSRKPNLTFDTTEAFLQVIVEGEKSLYYYKDQDAKGHFYIRQEGKLVLLKFKKYLKNVNGKRVIGLNRAYIGQLINYLQGCGSIVSKVNETTYSRNSLKRLFMNYYACRDERPAFHKQAEKVLIQPGLLAGLSATKLNFKSSVFPIHNEMELSVSTNITAGLSLAFVMPRNHRQWSLNSELLYLAYRTSGKQENVFPGLSAQISHLEFGQSYLKLNQMLRYTFPYREKYLFANGGISTSIVLAETNLQQVENGFFTLQQATETQIFPQTDGYEFEFFLGGGMQWNRFTLEMRYEFGNGPSRLVYMRSPMNRGYVLLGYRLGG